MSATPVALSTRIKTWLNRALATHGLRIDTLTAEGVERARIAELDRSGHFARPAFPLLPVITRADSRPVLESLRAHRSRFDSFVNPADNATGFCIDNDYFSSPDAEVLYCMIRRHAPRCIVEVGSGHSTRVSRLAIEDGGLGTRLVCIDPAPREEVSHLADELHRTGVETQDHSELFASLGRGDILFIDSSHEVRIGNDTVHLYLRVLPHLAAGVLVHIHDVFLPYEYPRDWVMESRVAYEEQYLVQAMLQESDRYEVLWPGYYLQRTMPDFSSHFAHLRGRKAQSFWLRRR